MRILIFAFAIFSLNAFSQNREVGLMLENDLYTSSKNDKYYTNGIEISYRFLNSINWFKAQKNISEFQVGQYIYNPQSVNAQDIIYQDRPFAAQLFGKYSRSLFYKNETVLQLSFTAGVIGPSALGEEFQNLIHSTITDVRVKGWDDQIKNTAVVQGDVFVSKKLFRTNIIDANATGKFRLGNSYTGATIGLLTRIGFKNLLSINNSNMLNASVDKVFMPKKISEIYFYIWPTANYQLYDATIMGGLFQDTNPVTFNLIPFRFNGEAGVRARFGNMNFSYAFVYRSQEVRNNVNQGYFYGSISASFLF